MKRSKSFFLGICLLATVTASAQFRDVPSEVTAAFAKQYPGAEQVSYKDNLKNFNVHFVSGGEKMIASYTSKGEWKQSEKTTGITKLPKAVQDGFQKSKYADGWKVSEAIIFYEPGNIERYKIKVEKGDLQRKNLFFNKEGRLMKDGVSL
ncbi:MAG TPA: PepSY-like domain-containing protein [Flavisolibacter sp.]|nr:PepSY-like domain-containing protein [Flavisolibacter sp.]